MRLEIYSVFSCMIFHSVQVVFEVEKLSEKNHLAPFSSVLGTIIGSQSVVYEHLSKCRRFF